MPLRRNKKIFGVALNGYEWRPAMNLIAAVDANWGIGYNNELLVHIPEDQKFFREMTTGKVVVMGRKTLESFPGKRPLKNRTNVVLTRNAEYAAEGTVLVHDIKELQELLTSYENDDIFVIGGETVYRALLPYCDTAYITKVEKTFLADAHFPRLDEDANWELKEQGETKSWEGIPYTFCIYTRNK